MSNHQLTEPKLIQPPVHNDLRGSFIKPFNYDQMPVDFKEYFVSNSNKGVIRGLHFQKPPFDHSKLVSVLSGSIIDVIVDLRKNSKTFQQVQSFSLNSSNGHSLFIPTGFAHGFLSLEDNTIVSYLVSSTYSKESDDGILYSSIDFDWNIKSPILSNRDLGFQTLQNYDSPF
ncbi:MAG: dTDP-4-dehydrorhamnose 3,5-epimerase family protein [Candidatus Cloacimonetes bacterium]|nr:dTDP-4-dehydrorhamnose 3,5-epimerase family protein [Candidatus Cloacimonadota bacterium]